MSYLEAEKIKLYSTTVDFSFCRHSPFPEVEQFPKASLRQAMVHCMAWRWGVDAYPPLDQSQADSFGRRMTSFFFKITIFQGNGL